MIQQTINQNVPETFALASAPIVVLENGGGDEAFGVRPSQFFNYSDTEYGLLYLAQETSSNLTRSLKLATALKDGFNHNWTKQGTVLTKGSNGEWDEGIGGGSVLKYGNEWILIYDGFTSGKIGIATGTDLLSLTKNPSNPVMDNTSTSGFNKYLRHPNLNIKDGVLYCHYEGRLQDPKLIINSQAGYATAPLNDITNWTINNTPVIYANQIQYALGQNASICNYRITEFNGFYYLWFQAYSPQNSAFDVSLGGTSYAYSQDLINWEIVGTKNYHLYHGLFGYSSSDQFYYTAQETTPVFFGNHRCIYIWDLTSPFIGMCQLNNGSFENIERDFTVFDDFNDNSIDTSKWTVGSGNGISITESGGQLSIICDGASSETGFPTLLESKFSLNNDDVGSVITVFGLTVSEPLNGDIFVIELSNSDRSYGIRLQQSSTDGKILFRIVNNGAVSTIAEVDFTGSAIFKLSIVRRNLIQLYYSDINGDFIFIDDVNFTNLQNQDLNFKIIANNSVGVGQRIDLDFFTFTEYDSGILARFQQ